MAAIQARPPHRPASSVLGQRPDVSSAFITCSPITTVRLLANACFVILKPCGIGFYGHCVYEGRSISGAAGITLSSTCTDRSPQHTTGAAASEKARECCSGPLHVVMCRNLRHSMSLTKDVWTSNLHAVQNQKNPPGRVRDAILQVLSQSALPMSIPALTAAVAQLIGETPQSSIRSYLRLNTPDLFVREKRGVYRVSKSPRQRSMIQFSDAPPQSTFRHKKATLHQSDCFSWLDNQPANSIHAVVTDPPYGLHEYAEEQQIKLRNGKGGVWRIPPSFDGHRRSPLPRFTTLTAEQLDELTIFFRSWARLLIPRLVPGANVIVASNPLVSHRVSNALSDAGLERRGEIIRLTMTMRGGDRPKSAHEEFAEVSVMPRSMWEPWLVYRKPIEGRVQDNLRKYGTGGFRRPSKDQPFGDVIQSSPTRKAERDLAPHPSLKPQGFLRRIVRAALPLGKGVILDPFAGAGSTLAACNVIGYESIGIEKDPHYFHVAVQAIPKLTLFSGNGVSKPCKSNRPSA